jgi:hypothetical protein
MVLPVEAADEQGVAKPSIARVRDYWLGGWHNSELDRGFADRTAMCAPHIPYLVRAQRALLGRVVRYLVGQGVRQFLDLGSGLPTLGHIHEVAQGIDPASRVVYVDNDSGVVDDGRQLIAGNENAVFAEADIREPSRVLNAPEARRLLDLTKPVAVLAIATLQHIPDSDDPGAMIAVYREAMCPGSYLGVSHYGLDEQLAAGYKLFDEMNLGKRPEVSLRDLTSVSILFTGLEIVSPGIVPLVLWRPDPDDELGHHPERHPVYVGVGRKP